MKIIILLFTALSLVGCSTTSPKETLCKTWIQEDGEYDLSTAFKPDGTFTSEYADGTSTSGTWEQTGKNTFLMKIGSGEMTGTIKGNKLVIKREKIYVEKK